MVIKLIACLMIIAGAAGISFDKAEKMGKRRLWYEQLQNYVRLLILEIKYSNLELTECLSRSCTGQVNFFTDISRKALIIIEKDEGLSFSDIWVNTINQAEKQFDKNGCDKYDKELLMSLGSLLGESSQDRQTKQLEAFLELIKNKGSLYSEGLAQKQKAVRFLGVCIGMFIVLILI